MVYAVVEMVFTIQYVDLTTLYRHSDSPTMTRAIQMQPVRTFHRTPPGRESFFGIPAVLQSVTLASMGITGTSASCLDGAYLCNSIMLFERVYASPSSIYEEQRRILTVVCSISSSQSSGCIVRSHSRLLDNCTLRTRVCYLSYSV
jgi:hypothetical protein